MAGSTASSTASSALQPALQDRTTFVLVQPSHAGNVGGAARAIKVMGFGQLVLVAPRWADVLLRDEAVAMASGATDVLAAARVVPTLADALQGSTWVCATAMTPRDFGPATLAPRAHLAPLAASAHSVAFVFGPERTGLSNDDVYRCHVCLSIPTHPDYGSLNLAQAVQLIAYDWRQALGGFELPEGAATHAARVPHAASSPLADGHAMAGLLAHWQQTLAHIGFLDLQSPKKLMPRLNQLLNRAQLTQDEVHILRGIARAVAQAAQPSPRPADALPVAPDTPPAGHPASHLAGERTGHSDSEPISEPTSRPTSEPTSQPPSQRD